MKQKPSKETIDYLAYRYRIGTGNKMSHPDAVKRIKRAIKGDK